MVLKILLFLMPSFSLLVKIYKKTGCTVPASGRKQPVFLCRFPNFFRIFILLLQFTDFRSLFVPICPFLCSSDRNFQLIRFKTYHLRIFRIFSHIERSLFAFQTRKHILKPHNLLVDIVARPHRHAGLSENERHLIIG